MFFEFTGVFVVDNCAATGANNNVFKIGNATSDVFFDFTKMGSAFFINNMTDGHPFLSLDFFIDVDVTAF